MEYNDYLKGFCDLSEIRGQFDFFSHNQFNDYDAWLLSIRERLFYLCKISTEPVRYRLASLYGMLWSYTYLTFSDMALDDMDSKILDGFACLMDFYKEGTEV